MKVTYKKPLLFYTLSTIFPWSFWFIAGYVSNKQPYNNANLDIASYLGFMGLITPMLIAVVMIYKNQRLKADILQRFFNFTSFKKRYLLIASLLMLCSILLAQLISLFFGYSPHQFSIPGHFSFTSGIFPVWFMLIAAPVFEELAWHTYGTDTLRTKFSLFWTSMIFGLFWGVWHIPLSTIRDYYQSHLVVQGWIYSVNFLVSIFPFVILMNWLYVKTNRNIIVPIIFHISAGFFNEIFATDPDSKIIQTCLLIVISLFVIIKNTEMFFASEKFSNNKLVWDANAPHN